MSEDNKRTLAPLGRYDKKDYHIAWADPDNDASADDDGLLQGDVISVASWTIPSCGTALQFESSTIQASPVTIEGVTYPANTVTTLWVSAVSGAPVGEYEALGTIVTSGTREYGRKIIIPIREQI